MLALTDELMSERLMLRCMSPFLALGDFSLRRIDRVAIGGIDQSLSDRGRAREGKGRIER